MLDEKDKKIEEENEEEKGIKYRVEELVEAMERNNQLISKIYSWRGAFVRGLFYGLGIIVGSTIVAGMLYSLSIYLFGEDFIKQQTLEYLLEQEKDK